MAPKVLIPMADYGHDPTETAIPYTTFKAAGFNVTFATETGKAPECDKKMLEGVTQKLLVHPSRTTTICHSAANLTG
jgi:putative intracellular protease/amidase